MILKCLRFKRIFVSIFYYILPINPFAGIEPKIIQQKDLITFEGYIIK